MASLERTAYPKFPRAISDKELSQAYTFSEEEKTWVEAIAQSPSHRLGLAVLLKVFQQLYYFPELSEIPEEVIKNVRQCFNFGDRVKIAYSNTRTYYRHTTAIRSYLGVSPFYGADARETADRIAQEAAEILDQRVDIINALIDELALRRIELPAFSTLDTLAEQAHATVQESLFKLVLRRVSPSLKETLDRLLDTDFGRRQSDFNTLKQTPKKPTRKHLEVLIDHLTWLESFGDLNSVFKNIRETKIRHFSSQAMAFDVSELKECTVAKRYTLMLALIYQMRVRTRDHLAEMFIRRMATIQGYRRDEAKIRTFGM